MNHATWYFQLTRRAVDGWRSGIGGEDISSHSYGVLKPNAHPTDGVSDIQNPVAASHGFPPGKIGSYGQTCPNFLSDKKLGPCLLFPCSILLRLPPVYVFGPVTPPSPPLPRPVPLPMHHNKKTVVVLGASYAGKPKICHVCPVHLAHTTLSFPTQVTEQFTSSWKNFPRTGEWSSLKETRTYYSPHLLRAVDSFECFRHFNRTSDRVSITFWPSFDPGAQSNLSHIADLYTLPRLAVLRGHEHKACG